MHCGEVMYFGCVCFKGERGFLSFYAICMCVVNKKFELLEFVLIPFMLTCSMMRFISRLLLGLCPCNTNNNIYLKSNTNVHRGTSSVDYITKCIYNNQQ